jgi:hypothetical protein
MKYVLLLISFIALVSSKNNEQLHSIKQDEKITNLIASLPEVTSSNQAIIKKTKGKIHLVTYIDQRPNKQVNYYLVTVAEDQKWRFMPHFTFKVDAKTFAISYWAIIEDKFIPLSTWRKHHYKEY